MVFEQLRDLICEMLDVDENAVTMDSVILEDFDADSLDLVEIVMGVEEQFGIEIPDNAIEEFHTVGDVVRYIEDHTGSSRKRNERLPHSAAGAFCLIHS